MSTYTYSLWRSKTFWTLVATFVVTGGNAIAPMIPPNAEVFVSALLLILGSYFHLSTAAKAGAVN